MSPPLHHRFSNHQKPLAILREKVRGVFNGKAKELKKAGATRMGSHTFVGERLEELKSSLQATVVDERYTAENYCTSTGATSSRLAMAGQCCASTRAAPQRSWSWTTLASGKGCVAT